MAEKEVLSELDHWVGDYLGRKSESELLIRFLVTRVAERKRQGLKGSYVLNIDARYGEGKSFFIERFKQDLAKDYSVAYVNAWKDDHAEDPLIPLMIAIDAAFKGSTAAVKKAAKNLLRKSGEVTVTVGKHVLTAAARKYLGVEIGELAGELGGSAKDAEEVTGKAFEELISKNADAALAKFQAGQKTIGEFKGQLHKLIKLQGAKKPLFVLVDELDRCRPTYAISLLERVKHLFDTDDVVFVIATDTEQLRHAVSAVYGQAFNGAGYLLRFFNRTYRFATPSKDEYIRFLFTTHEIPTDRLSSPLEDNHVEFFGKVADLFNLTLREIETCFDILRSVVTDWRWSARLKIELVILLPLIIFHCRGEIEKFRRLAALVPTDLPKTSSPSIKYRYRAGREVSDGSIGVSQLIEEFANSARIALPDIRPNDVERPPQEWVKRRFMEEFAIVHSNSWRHPGPHSVCAQYGEIVRAVGRLTDLPRD